MEKWIADRKKYYNMSAIIRDKTSIDVYRWKNYTGGKLKLSDDELKQIIDEMKKLAK